MTRHPLVGLVVLVVGGAALLAGCAAAGYFIADLIMRAAEPARLAAVTDEAATWTPQGEAI